MVPRPAFEFVSEGNYKAIPPPVQRVPSTYQDWGFPDPGVTTYDLNGLQETDQYGVPLSTRDIPKPPGIDSNPFFKSLTEGWLKLQGGN